VLARQTTFGAVRTGPSIVAFAFAVFTVVCTMTAAHSFQCPVCKKAACSALLSSPWWRALLTSAVLGVEPRPMSTLQRAALLTVKPTVGGQAVNTLALLGVKGATAGTALFATVTLGSGEESIAFAGAVGAAQGAVAAVEVALIAGLASPEPITFAGAVILGGAMATSRWVTCTLATPLLELAFVDAIESALVA